MPILIEQDWRSYIRNGDETTAELLSGNSPVIATLDAFDGFFRKRLWTGEDDLSPSQMLLALHSYMVLLAGVRLALTGHAAATFPLFRTALEAACYALLMKTDKEYETAWLERDQSPAKTKACRVMFTSAVRDAARYLNLAQAGYGNPILQSYQAAIDFGAHPNPRSILAHVGEPEDAGQFWKFTLTGLHHSESYQVVHSLVAALDYMQIVAIILVRLRGTPRTDVLDALNTLNDQKEQLVADLNAAARAG